MGFFRKVSPRQAGEFQKIATSSCFLIQPSHSQPTHTIYTSQMEHQEDDEREEEEEEEVVYWLIKKPKEVCLIDYRCASL